MRAENNPTKIDITPKMIRAGVGAYYSWNQDREEIEALVFSVYFNMVRAAKLQPHP